MVQVEDCFEIAELPANPLDEIRAKEKELGLNARLASDRHDWRSGRPETTDA